MEMDTTKPREPDLAAEKLQVRIIANDVSLLHMRVPNTNAMHNNGLLSCVTEVSSGKQII